MGYANNIGYGLNNNNSIMMGNSYNIPGEYSTAYRNTPMNLYFNSESSSNSNNASGFKQPAFSPFSGASSNQNFIVSLLMQLMQLLSGNNMNSTTPSYYPNNSYTPSDQSLLSDSEKNSLYKESLSIGKSKPTKNVVIDEPLKKPVENVVVDEPVVEKPVKNVVVDEPVRSAAKKVYVFGNSNHGNNNDFWKDFKKNNFDGVLDKLSPEAKAAANKYGKTMEGESIVIDENGELVGVYKTTKLENKTGADMGRMKAGKDGKGSAKGKNITLDGQSLEIVNNAWVSPLAFDLNGDGVKTKKNKISYDIDGDGKKDKINDVNDGILCVNGGKDGKDLFGDNTDIDRDGKADGKDGFESLKVLALKEGLINGEDDMKLDKADIKTLEQKYDLGIKQGYKGKVRSLEDVGIDEISLAKTNETDTIDNFDKKGNKLMTQQGATFKIDGKEREYADIWYKKY